MSEDLEIQRDNLRNLVKQMITSGGNGSAPRIGDLAMGMGMVTQSDLTRALSRQSRNGSRRPLIGQVLLQGGLLTQDQLDILLSEQSRLAMSGSEAAEQDDDGLRGIAARIEGMKGRI